MTESTRWPSDPLKCKIATERGEAASIGRGVWERLCFPVGGLVSGEVLVLAGALEGGAWFDGRVMSARSLKKIELRKWRGCLER